MADSPAFECICTELESQSSLDRLEARGTVRLVLKSAGLEAKSITQSHADVAISKLLPDELRARGIDDTDRICEAIKRALGQVEDMRQADTPENVFARLGSS